MHGGDRGGEFRREHQIELVTLGAVIERGVFVEAGHVDRPFDGFALAAEREPAVRLASDRNNAMIELRGEFSGWLQARRGRRRDGALAWSNRETGSAPRA